MKQFLYIITFLFIGNLSAQDSGTFKVVKKEKEEAETTENKFKSEKYEIGVYSVFGGKNSPELIRDIGITAGYSVFMGGHEGMTFGLNVSKSNRYINYKGNAFGGFISFNGLYRLILGPGVIWFSTEISYNKLLNDNDYPDLNQYGAGLGINLRPLVFFRSVNGFSKSIKLTVLGTYYYDTNSIDTFKGIYPGVRISYLF